jgi:Glycosyltransferase sugar-binding region containing DXD motif
MWKDGDVPQQFRSLVASVRQHQPDYEYRLWTDTDVEAFVRERAPQFADAYTKFSKRIEQIDFARYLILHEIGGAYFDLDVVSLRSIDPLVATGRVVLGLECSEHTQQFRPRPSRVVSNAVMISPPRERFWLDLMQHVVSRYADWRWWWHRGPVYRTGPLALTSFVDSRSGEAAGRLTILPSCAFCPMSDHWNDGHVVDGYDSISRDCESLDDTYAVHLWSHSWLPPWVQRFNQRKRRVLTAAAAVVDRCRLG